MPVGAAVGYPQTSGVLIPTVWSGKLLVEYYEATCLSQITNTDYEGEIKSQGDKVQIRTLPNIDVFDYVKGQDLNYAAPQPDLVTLNIDKAKYWAFTTDSIDKYQSDLDYVNKWTAHAGEKTVRRVERDVFADVIADPDTYNQGNSAGKISQNIRLGALGATASHVGLTAGASGTVNKINVLEFVANCGQVLDENDVPEDGRWMVLPAFAINLIKVSDLKNVYVSGDSVSIYRNGRVGEMDRFTIYKSNLLTSVLDAANTVTYALFGHQSALTWAAQFTENDTLKSERSFGWKFRGLNVYGYKTVKKAGLGRAIIRKAIGADT